jgi:tRNA dimethylallyltransferase
MNSSPGSKKKSPNVPKIIAVVGPTASGKSDLAVKLALWIERNKKKLGVSGAEVVSADSRQVYRGLDIGSGKITKKEMRGVPHWLLDVASPRRVFTAHDYRQSGLKVLSDIFRRGGVPIICGGTGFYVDSLIYSPFLPEVPPQPRLRKELADLSLEQLAARLEKSDPDRLQDIDIKNRRRLERAIEIAETLGRPVPKINRNLPYPTLILGISIEREKLKAKISRRLKLRLKQGLIEEVHDLHHRKKVSWKRLEELGLEYRFVARYLQGKIDRREMNEELEKEIIRYAKRQMTWFRKEKGIVWVSSFSETEKVAAEFLKNPTIDEI